MVPYRNDGRFPLTAAVALRVTNNMPCNMTPGSHVGATGLWAALTCSWLLSPHRRRDRTLSEVINTQ
jgi:hypothetical protein